MQEDISTLPPGTRDITFAAPKSVSVLMALLPADDERSSKLFDSHDIAVDDTVAWLGKEAAFARSGPAFLDCQGLRCHVVRHHSTVTRQPHVHSHILVEPTVLGLDDRLHPLDWATFDHAMVAAPALYLARLRRELVNELGVTWSRDHHESEWGIVGIPDRLLAEWSDATCVLPGLPQTVAVSRSAR